MSEENVEIVRRGFDAFLNRGAEAIVEEFAAPDGVWHPVPEWPEATEYRGHDGLRFLLAILPATFDDWAVNHFELRDAGDAVVVLVEHGGKIKGTDTPIRQELGMVVSDFRGGRAGRVRFFQRWRETLEAAGLSN